MFDRDGTFNKKALEVAGLREGYYFIASRGDVFITLISKNEWSENMFEIRDASNHSNNIFAIQEAIELLINKYKKPKVIIKGIYIDFGNDKFEVTN